MEVVEAEHRRQMTVHRRSRPGGRVGVGDDHSLGRGAKPRHEPAQILQPHNIPARTPARQELEEQPQARRVRPHGVRRPLDRLQVRQVRLDRLHPDRRLCRPPSMTPPHPRAPSPSARAPRSRLLNRTPVRLRTVIHLGCDIEDLSDDMQITAIEPGIQAQEQARWLPRRRPGTRCR